jgi:hypothetical protein
MGVDPDTAMGCAGGAMTLMGDSYGVFKRNASDGAVASIGAGGQENLGKLRSPFAADAVGLRTLYTRELESGNVEIRLSAEFTAP